MEDVQQLYNILMFEKKIASSTVLERVLWHTPLVSVYARNYHRW
jgi:hypothetical protein